MNIRPTLYAFVLAGAAASQAAPLPKTAAKPAAKSVAKPTARPAIKAAGLAPLPIALPPGAKVEFEVDGSDDDVLGMVKSFASGLEESNGSKTAAQATQSGSPWLALLGDKQLSAILKDVRHLHLIVYKLPHDDDNSPTMGAVTSGSMDAHTPTFKPTGIKPLTLENFNALSFHEKPLLAAGGRLSLQADMKSTKIRMFAFDAPRGFGLVAQGPSRIIVARSQGYPNMAVLGRLIRLGNGG